MQMNFTQPHHSPEIAAFLFEVETNRRPTGGVTPTKPLLTAWIRLILAELMEVYFP
jgi:hypothetical protein